MKFGQLIEYNIRNVFFEKSSTKCCLEANTRPFHKKIKVRHISGSTVWNDKSLFLTNVQSQDLPKYIKTKMLTTCF